MLDVSNDTGPQVPPMPTMPGMPDPTKPIPDFDFSIRQSILDSAIKEFDQYSKEGRMTDIDKMLYENTTKCLDNIKSQTNLSITDTQNMLVNLSTALKDSFANDDKINKSEAFNHITEQLDWSAHNIENVAKESEARNDLRAKLDQIYESTTTPPETNKTYGLFSADTQPAKDDEGLNM